MERGNKKVLKEHSLPLGPVILRELLPKEQTCIEPKYLAKTTVEHGDHKQSVSQERRCSRPKQNTQKAKTV